MLVNAANVSRNVWQVGALCQAAADVLDTRFNPVTVAGEVSGFTRASSGHCYFTLKDESAQLRCAMFRRAASLLDFTVRDGDRVEVRGRLGVYEPRGDLQLVAESMVKEGAGALLQRFLLLKAQLEAQGLFDSQRKRPVPAMPRVIGLVTSLGGAALHDVLAALERRAPHVRVIISPAQVQGSAAAAEVVQALQALYALCGAAADRSSAPDVILLVRGGGAAQDLWTFNEEAVVRAVVASPVPLISGVGHETDFTLVDLAADLRAPTPTAAAELACEARDEQLAALRALHGRWSAATARVLDRLEQRLDMASLRLGRPMAGVTAAMGHCARLQQKMQSGAATQLGASWRQGERMERLWRSATAAHLQRGERDLERLALRLAALDPALVLQRGYAWLADGAGRPVVSVTQIQAGQQVRASLADGRVDLTVLGTAPD